METPIWQQKTLKLKLKLNLSGILHETSRWRRRTKKLYLKSAGKNAQVKHHKNSLHESVIINLFGVEIHKQD